MATDLNPISALDEMLPKLVPTGPQTTRYWVARQGYNSSARRRKARHGDWATRRRRRFMLFSPRPLGRPTPASLSGELSLSGSRNLGLTGSFPPCAGALRARQGNRNRRSNRWELQRFWLRRATEPSWSGDVVRATARHGKRSFLPTRAAYTTWPIALPRAQTPQRI